MLRSTPAILGLGLAIALMPAARAQSVTFDFTAVTAAVGWQGVTSGERVVGSYTFDVTQGLAYGVVGSPAGWENLLQGGPGVAGSLPLPSSFVFTSSVQVFDAGNNVVASYSTRSAQTPGLYEVTSQIVGGNLGQAYSASETVYSSASAWTSSSVNILNLAGTYGPDGYPLPIVNTNPLSGGFDGSFWIVPNPFAAQYVNYVILNMSLAPAAPEPSSGILLLAGMGAMALVIRRRHGAWNLSYGR